MRRYQTRIAEIVLQRFSRLDEIPHVHLQPVERAWPTEVVPPDRFAEHFQASDSSPNEPLQFDIAVVAEVPPITAREVEVAARRRANARCADEAGIVAEMLKHASRKLHEALAEQYNRMLHTCRAESGWHHVVFTMLPKSGDLKDPGNWRPIAVLRVLQKLFSRILLHRLQPTLDAEQSPDQFGFRPGVCIEDAFTVLGDMCAKTTEWRMPLWWQAWTTEGVRPDRVVVAPADIT